MTIISDAPVPADTLDYIRISSKILLEAYSNSAAAFVEELKHGTDSIPLKGEFDELARIADGARAARDLAYYASMEELTVGKLAQLCVDKIQTLSMEKNNLGVQVYSTLLNRVLSRSL